MGYTHYWENKENVKYKDWSNVCVGVSVVLDVIEKSVKLTGCYKGEVPFINEEVIIFNGFENEGHETFQLDRSPTNFGLCKTVNKPYDLAVCSTLLIADYYIETFSYSSDGDTEEWDEAVDLVNTILDINVNFKGREE